MQSFFKVIFVLCSVFWVSEAQCAWRTNVAYSTVSEHKVEILEAVMFDNDFYDKTIIKVGCRYSYPTPSIYIKFPALTTNLMIPSEPAYVYFSSELKKIDSGYKVGALVGAGDSVIVPVGNEEQERLLEDIYIMFSDVEDNGAYMKFVQGRHVFTYALNLENFTRSYYLAKSTCANIAQEDSAF